ncbi:hypothetical protein J6590_032264, partial [Homalodisca vitripennis]
MAQIREAELVILHYRRVSPKSGHLAGSRSLLLRAHSSPLISLRLPANYTLEVEITEV